MAAQKSPLQNSYVKIAVAIGLIAVIVLGFYVALTFALGNSVPVRVVSTGSMCTASDGCDGWSCNFLPTLHVGDLIFIQTLNPPEYNAAYPYSDILVYQPPNSNRNPETCPVAHRIVAKYQDSSGVWYFQTKGDGVGTPWPAEPSESECDSHTFWTTCEGVSQDLVYGRVVMRVPYVGLVAIFVQNNLWVLPAAVLLVMLAVVVKLSFGKIKLRCQKQSSEQQNNGQKPL